MGNDMNSDYIVNNNYNCNSIHVNLSTSNPKIKYYDCNDSTCIFKIIDDNLGNNNIGMNSSVTNYKNQIKSYINNKKDNLKGDSDCIEQKKDNYYTSNMTKNKLSDCHIECHSQHIIGKIVVVSMLNCGQEKSYLEGIKVNVYRLNGVCPIFVKSCLTDKSGKAIFNNLPEGCYRVIEIINKTYFQKPKYIKWNEVCISKDNTEESIIIVNNLKQCSKNKVR